jgi:hypothetical protein
MRMAISFFYFLVRIFFFWGISLFVEFFSEQKNPPSAIAPITGSINYSNLLHSLFKFIGFYLKVYK